MAKMVTNEQDIVDGEKDTEVPRQRWYWKINYLNKSGDPCEAVGYLVCRKKDTVQKYLGFKFGKLAEVVEEMDIHPSADQTDLHDTGLKNGVIFTSGGVGTPAVFKNSTPQYSTYVPISYAKPLTDFDCFVKLPTMPLLWRLAGNQFRHSFYDVFPKEK